MTVMPIQILFVFLVLAGRGSAAVPQDRTAAECMMQPAELTIQIPKTGFAKCQAINGKWIRKPLGPHLKLCVIADGPSGSIHSWNITVGISRSRQSKPYRGICLETSTVGWRTLLHWGSALPWIEDVDADGRAEFILWDSFPLTEEASLAEFGLMAWVYRVDDEDNLTIDWGLSRKMARKIAAAYRISIKGILQPRRDSAAVALERFADGACTMPSQ